VRIAHSTEQYRGRHANVARDVRKTGPIGGGKINPVPLGGSEKDSLLALRAPIVLSLGHERPW